MEIKVKITGPLENAKGLFIAEGKCGGQKCEVIVQDAGNGRLGLVLPKTRPSIIGSERVISYSGDISTTGTAKIGTELAFNCNAVLRPYGEKLKGKAAEELSEVKRQMADLAALVAEQAETLSKQQTPK